MDGCSPGWVVRNRLNATAGRLWPSRASSGGNPVEGASLAGLGKSLLLAKRHREAVNVLRQSGDALCRTNQHEFAALMLCHLGSALLKTNRSDEAFAAFDEASRLDPSFDILEILYIGFEGKVRSASRLVAESILVELARPYSLGKVSNSRRRRKRKRH